MALAEFVDGVPLIVFLIVSIGVMIGFVEFGFIVGQHHQGKPNKAQMAQVRAIMGALLGLLAFMLAFSFSMGQSHFEDRARAYMLEANAVEDAYRSADLLEQEAEMAVRDLLRQFVDSRVKLRQAVNDNQKAEVNAQFLRSEQLTDRLWDIATRASAESGETDKLLTASVLAMMDAAAQRQQAALYNRISSIIWITLLAMSLLSMTVMGYQAGLTGTRSRLATWTLAIAFSAVITLVTDLDRPRMSLFSVNHQIMLNLQQKMSADEDGQKSREPLFK